jgi:hypothetical protein
MAAVFGGCGCNLLSGLNLRVNIINRDLLRTMLTSNTSIGRRSRFC